MQSILKTVKLCICMALMAVIFPMSVYAGSDEGMVEVTGSGSSTLEEIVKEEPDIWEQVQATAAEAVDDAMGVPRGTVSMVIRFCDSDGNILAEADFRAE